MSFVEQVSGWAEPRPSSVFDRIRQWRAAAGSLFAPPQRTLEDAFIFAVARGDTRQARKLLAQGAACDAQNFRALRILAVREDYGGFIRASDRYGFTPEIVTRFAYAGLTQAARGRNEEIDAGLLYKFMRIIDNDIPGRREEQLRSLQMQAIRFASPEIVMLLLDARSKGYNDMLREKRKLFDAKIIDTRRDDELNKTFGRWAVVTARKRLVNARRFAPAPAF